LENRVLLTNSAPVAAADSLTVEEDFPGCIDVLANDSDPDMMDTISFVSASNGTHGTVTANSYGLDYAPDYGFSGSDSFTYVIQDSNGASATGTVTVTINPNHAPIAVNDSLTVEQDFMGSVEVTTNDYDPDMMDSITVLSAGNGANGTTYLTSYGVQYTPNTGFHGTDSFTYTILDSRGLTATGTVNVTVTADQAPVAANDTLTVDYGMTGTAYVLMNDSDPDMMDTLSVASAANGTHGTTMVTSDGVQYTPEAGFSGADSFTYVVQDSRGATATATVNVTVNIQTTVTASVTYNTHRSVTITGQLTSTNPGGQRIDFAGVVNGWALTQADGSYSFPATASGVGSVTVSYANAMGASTTIQVTSDAPVVSGMDVVIGTGDVATFSGSVTDEEPEGLVVTITGYQINGTATVQADGTFSYSVQLPPAYSGSVSAVTTDWWGQMSNSDYTYV
jgi:hypothetical protein